MRFLRSLAFSAIAFLVAAPALAQGAADVPRNETLIVENPEGTIKNAGWFNIWATNAGGQSTGLHQLAMDTFWYIDPDHGLDGVWDNSLAAEPPIYNDDFTEMTVKLRPGHLLERRRRVHGRRRGLHHQHPSEHQRPRPQRAVPAQRREHRGARQVHRRLQAEEAELALPFAVHGALERGLDDAQARLRGEGPAQVRLQPAGLARRLHAAQLRPERAVVHLAEARRLGAHVARPLRRAGADVMSPISTRVRRTSG